MPTAQTEAPALQYMDAVAELSALKESAINPRRIFDDAKLKELAESIRQYGVMQPIVARAAGKGTFEVIFGERRRRAAKLAGLASVPVRVCEMNDEEVLTAQLVENDQREDVHPLEEADGYKRLRDEHGKSVDEIAAKLGRPRSHVYQRLQLCALKTAARALFMSGKLTASTALLVARIADEKLQAKAAKEISEGPYREGPMSLSMATDHVQRNYMLRLELASFDTKSELLVPEAGACSACPKRTGNQRELFSDVKSPDVCTDPACFEKKSQAGWKVAAAAAKDKGQKVLSDTESKKLFPYPGRADRLSGSAEYVDLRDKPYEDTKGRTYAQLLGREPEASVLARDQAGGVHRLFPKKGLRKALKDAGHDFWKRDKPKPKTEKQKAEEQKYRDEKEAEDFIGDEVIREVVGKIEKHEPGPAQWAELLDLWLHDAYSELDGVMRRRKLGEPEGAGTDNAKVLAHAKTLTVSQARALFLEVAILDTLGEAYNRKRLEQLASAFGVDLKAAKKRATEAAKAARAARKEQAAAESQAAKLQAKDAKGKAGKKR